MEIFDPEAHYGVRLTALSPEVRALQVYSPLDQPFVVIEPQFNWADPFSPVWPKDVNTGMVILTPGQEVTWAVRVEFLRCDPELKEATFRGTLIKRTAMIAGAGAGCAMLAWKFWKRAELRRNNRSIPANQKVRNHRSRFRRSERSTGALKPPACGKRRANHACRSEQLPLVHSHAHGGRRVENSIRSTYSLRRACYPHESILNKAKSMTSTSRTNQSYWTLEDHGASRRTLKADHVVIALGSVPNFHGIPGIQEHSLGLKSIGDAAAIRNRILEALEHASWEQDSTVRKELLTFVVGGGGYTGVETMAAINDLVRTSAEALPEDVS